ncbi:MAG: sulfotransferase family protein [Deltaproteobacteria bacterium]
MAIYIAGMHRSNSSILSLMLGACGVDLGPPSEDFPPHEEDNPDGYGENVPLVRMNDAVLKALGGAWNAPPEPPSDWMADRRLQSVREKAKALLRRRAAQEPWGWKDPRNCLTLPFWRSIVPVNKVIIPLRHPLEVAESFKIARGIAVAEGLRLWEIYNRRITDAASSEERLICHADALCRNHEAELRRMLEFLGLRVTADGISAACRLFRNDRRRHQYRVSFTADPRLTPGIVQLYERLCEEAGLAR